MATVTAIIRPDRVAAEMACVKDLFRPDQLWFADDIFGLSAKWTREFAAQVEQRQAHIPFRMQSRCDLMTRDTVEALARAGCVEVWMGAESGSQRILDAMEKGIRVEQIRQARENLRRHGIRACMFLQFGYLGEEWQDIESTIRLVRDTKPDDIGVSVSYPMPNTRFHQIVKAQLGAKDNWSDSGDLATMFQGQLPAEFYRALADALHLEVAQSASSDALAPRLGESRESPLRLLLTHGFFLGEDPKEQQVMRPYPPLGILYLSAYLRAKGFDVDVYDSTWGSKSELYGILERGPAGWLGVYGNLLTRGNVIEIVERARAAGWRIVLGGPEPANYAEEYLAAGADYVVQGEGELPLEQLLSGNPSPDGTIYRDASGAVVRMPGGRD